MTVLLENKQCLLRFYEILRSRIGLVADPSSAESGVRVEGSLTSLATTQTVGEISNTAFRLGSCLVGNTARRAKTLNISHRADRGEDGEEGAQRFPAACQSRVSCGPEDCHSASNGWNPSVYATVPMPVFCALYV